MDNPNFKSDMIQDGLPIPAKAPTLKELSDEVAKKANEVRRISSSVHSGLFGTYTYASAEALDEEVPPSIQNTLQDVNDILARAIETLMDIQESVY